MQLRALSEGRPLFAGHARKGKNYLCPECQNIIRLRGGPSRQLHFFHLRKHPTCRQHQKGPIHIQLQLAVQSLLPEGQVERSFPEIGRIADVACEKSKRIFEIQVSPISAEEVKARCADYESLGYQVIWILHEKRFNKRILTGAELALRKKCRYFSNFTEDGKGIIYDQFEQLEGARRLKRGPRLRVDLKTFSMQPLSHAGDLINRILLGQIKPLEQEKRKVPTFYRRVFQLFLQKKCR